MQFVQTGVAFTFNYPAYNQDAALFVRGSVYNVTTGTPAFVQNVTMLSVVNGIYTGNFIPVMAQSYLIVMSVYTDGTYAAVNSDYGPLGQIFKTLDAPEQFFAFNYGSFDYSNALYVAANIYDCTGVLPTFIAQVVMGHVLNGVYFSSYAGAVAHTYDAVKVVYTNNTYTTADPDRSPDSESFQIYAVAIQAFVKAVLKGQKLKAVLKESQC